MQTQRQTRVEKILGWKACGLRKNSVKRQIFSCNEHKIFELKAEEIFYYAELPELSPEEAVLIRRIIKKFQENNSKKISGFIENYCIEKSILIDKQQFEYFEKILDASVSGFSALDVFLHDSEIEEIAVTGTGFEKPVFVFHKKFGWIRTNVFFGSNNFVRDLANRMARGIGRRLTLESPKINANLPDGSRMTATIPPVSKEATITIRKFRHEAFTPAELIENKTFSSEFCALAWLATELDSGFLIAGNTGSGKTTTINCLLGFIPKQERIIIVEETPEIVLPHRHLVKLCVVKEQGFTMQSLITDTLRMRPDRVVVGEIRNAEETSAFMDTILAGQGKGSYATFHAQSAKEAVARLESFGIKKIDLEAIGLLIVQKRWPETEKSRGKEKRRVVEVAETIFSGQGLELNKLFEFDFAKDCLAKTGESKKIFGKARDYLGLDRQGFEKELEKKRKFLESFKGRNVSMKTFFEAINKNRE